MAEFLAPFRDRRPVLVAVIVAVLTLSALLVFGPSHLHEGSRLVSAVFLSCAFGCMAAAAVLFVRVAGTPRPGTVLDGVSAEQRTRIGRAVLRGDAAAVSASDEPPAIAFAQAYRSWLPRWTAPFIAVMLGVLLQAFGQLRTWDGGFASVLLVLEFALVAAGFLTLVPLQVRRLAVVERFLTGRR